MNLKKKLENVKVRAPGESIGDLEIPAVRGHWHDPVAVKTLCQRSNPSSVAGI